MMSQSFTTTWTCPPEVLGQHFLNTAHLPGTALVVTPQGAYLGLEPKRTLSLAPGPTAWEQLQAFVSTASLPVMGYLAYEMYAFADPHYPLPFYPSPLPVLVFFEPTRLYASYAIRLPTPTQPLPCVRSMCRSDLKGKYLEKIQAIQDSIAAGDIYQVNLSHSLMIEHEGMAPQELFHHLYVQHPAPYAAYMHCGQHQVLSLSPELMIEKRGECLRTSPIKGTAPRGATPVEDAELRKALQASAKERSELLMITDLMRHDLYQVSVPLTVRVEDLWHLEAYTDVFHLISTITGKCREDLHPVEVIRKLFPAGSVTGCPKRAALMKIAELEQRARGVYTGAIGMFSPQGDFCFNVAIRTLTMTDSHIELQLGGGVIYDSHPLAEYLETLHKGRTFFRVFAAS